MAQLSVVDLTTAGITPAGTAAASGGDSFLNNQPGIFVEVENTHASAARSVTFASQHLNTSIGSGRTDGLVKQDRTVSIAALTRKAFGPFPPTAWNDATGLVQITYADNTNLKVSVLRAAPLS